ncbi:MAG: diguanylate cyclase, partial [Anaeroplasmataceae bacterium]|nr:diguanylate cyclase [Anaeroplasmataceae bacterium]
TYGHNFGNRALQHISSKLKSTLRRSDIIARIGGDEFLVFFEEHKTQDATIQRIFNSLVEPFNDLHLSVSIGVASTKECGKEYDHLFNCADRALYKAKKDGKHCVRYYDESLTENSSNMTSIDDTDMENGSFVTLRTPEELKEFLKNLHSVYDRTRIYNVETAKCYHIDEDGNLIDFTKDDTYINAGRISAYGRALMTRGKASEIAYRGNNLYYINANYLECGIVPYVLEVIIPLRDDTIIDNHFTKTKMISEIDSHGEKKYKDLALNVYNKVFYEDQLKDSAGLYSIANIEVHVKEKDLEKVVSILKSHIRSTDIMIRYAENEFLIILEKIQEKHFKLITEDIYEDVSKVCKVYIGACQTLGRIEDLVLLAKNNLNLAKTGAIGYVYKNIAKE